MRFKKLNIFTILLAILLLYSFIPKTIAESTFWLRLYGAPIAYIPFFLLFLFMFLKGIGLSLIRRDIFIHKPIIIFLIFLMYFPFQFVFLLQRGPEIAINDYITDYLMFCFYGVVVFYGTTLYFYNKRNNSEIMHKIFDQFMKILFFICIIGTIRYFLFDYKMFFYNIFNPLRYRLFEVLFLVFFSALALGRFYATREKKYIFYFAIYGFSLILSGSRTGYIVFAFLIIYLLLRENYKLLSSIRGFVIILAITSAVFVGGDEITSRIKRLQEVSLYATFDLDRSIQEKRSARRITFLIASIDMIKESPLIGVGIGKGNIEINFPYYFYDSVGTIARPHNFYLYIMLSTGIIGTSIFLYFIFYIIKYGYRTFKKIRHNQPKKEMVLHLLISNILILIMKIGYEFETEPFIWMLWAFSFSYFICVRTELSNESARHARLVEQGEII